MASAEDGPPFNYINFGTQISVTKFLGRGGFGDVYGPCLWRDTDFAFKRLFILTESWKERDSVKNEIKESLKVWRSLNHRNLIKVWYASVDLSAIYIAMEYARGGTLTVALKSQSSPLPFSVVIEWAEQIADGMSYLHERSVVHRNLKSENVMIYEPFAPDLIREKTLKITDFDQIREFGASVRLRCNGIWLAPELVKTKIFSEASDVWSYGIVLWEILTRKAICEFAKGNVKSTIPHTCPGALRKLIEGCWERRQEKRPLFSVILSVLQNMSTSSSGVSRDGTESKVKERLKTKREPHGKQETDQQPESEDYEMNLKLQMEGDEASRQSLLRQTQSAIYGLAILKDEVFISYLQSSVIDVYGSTTFQLKHQLKVDGLTNPEHIVSCNIYYCLYSFDWSYRGKTSEILRIDPHTGKVIKNWKTFEGGGRLSVANDTNIILNMNYRNQLNEYTADGELLRRINLASGTDIVRAWHAIKLDSGLFLVCHGDYDDPKSRVCMMSISENDRFCHKGFDAEVVKAFGNQLRNLLKCPVYMDVDKEGSILVCDTATRLLLMLNSSLEEPRQLNPVEDATPLPWRVCVDDFHGRYLMADYNRLYACKVPRDGKIDWQIVLDKTTHTT